MKSTRLLLIGAGTVHGHEAIKGVEAYCRQGGMWEFHFEADSSPLVVTSTRQAIHKWKPHGIIAFLRSPQMKRVVVGAGVPVVNFDAANAWDIPTVISDSAAIGKLVARHFLDNGFRNFAFGPRTPDLHIVERCRIYVAELAGAGFDDIQVYCEKYIGPYPAAHTFEYRGMEDWLISLRKPVAIMSAYDSLAHEILAICRRLGLRVPDDVAVVGAGNDEILCRMSTPPLSSVDPDFPRIGYEAARLMHRLLRGGKAPARPILIPPRGIVTRQSSDIVAVDDPDLALAMRLIRRHALRPLSVKDILQQVHVCRKTLESKFEKVIGRTPHEEIVRVRMERAKDLVHFSDMPIKEIAHTMGFENANKFSYFFRRHTAQTPMRYRSRVNS